MGEATLKRNTSVFAWIKRHSTQAAAYSGLLLCIVVFTVLPPLVGSGESIWSADKLSTLIRNVIVLELMSVGAVFVYALGAMDISIGKQVGLYATLVVILGNSTGSLIWGVLLSLAIAVVIACINGASGELLHIHPIVSSVVFMMVLTGVSSVMYNTLGSRNVAMTAVDVGIFQEIWFMILALILEVLIVGYIFRYTRIGKNVKAIGANPVAAHQNGISLVRYKIAAYVVISNGLYCICFGFDRNRLRDECNGFPDPRRNALKRRHALSDFLRGSRFFHLCNTRCGLANAWGSAQ